MGYFKDISHVIANKYPNRNVYVISDQHFDHKNIIGLTRGDLFDKDEVDEMNKHIIKEHNKVVGEDDIVLMLGDFSFKKSNERISNYVSQLNGHKFLILGNHDNTDRIDIYLKAGFEDVYLYPIKFNGDYYSHYPLNASAKSKERPSTILYNSLCKEFKSSKSGINYHGHQHTPVNNGNREKNVTCENLSCRPLLVGKTKEKQDMPKPYIDEEFFDIMHRIMSKNSHYHENDIVTDYLYTIILEQLTEYKDDLAVFGSVMANKKYGLTASPSDLDITKLYNPLKSKRENLKEMKLIADKIYEKMNKVSGFNLDFYKKIDFICILSFIYASKKYNVTGYIDMNIILDEFYKSEDFMIKDGKTLLEYYTSKIGMKKPDTIKYPRFSIKTTNAFSDLTNNYLQYLYTTDCKKKKTLLQKMKQTLKNTNYNDTSDFDTLQNIMIRYLLRNIYFFENTKRTEESNFILLSRELELPSIVKRDNPIEDSLRIIVEGDEYNKILDSISKSNDRKKEITSILKQYKK